jgi:hypothetical protein
MECSSTRFKDAVKVPIKRSLAFLWIVFACCWQGQSPCGSRQATVDCGLPSGVPLLRAAASAPPGLKTLGALAAVAGLGVWQGWPSLRSAV